MRANELKEVAAKIASTSYTKPTNADIERVIAKLETQLAVKAINRHVNFAIKEGYTKAVELMKSRTTDLTKSAIGDLQTVQGRAIAMCAMDYMLGKCGDEVLGGVTIKTM